MERKRTINTTSYLAGLATHISMPSNCQVGGWQLVQKIAERIPPLPSFRTNHLYHIQQLAITCYNYSTVTHTSSSTTKHSTHLQKCP